MFISNSDKRLYIFCEDLLDSKYLEPPLHEELSRLLNNSTLKEYYYIDKSLSKSLNNIITPNNLN